MLWYAVSKRRELVPGLFPYDDVGFNELARSELSGAWPGTEWCGLTRSGDAVTLSCTLPTGKTLSVEISPYSVRKHEDAIIDGKPGNWKHEMAMRVGTSLNRLVDKVRAVRSANSVK